MILAVMDGTDSKAEVANDFVAKPVTEPAGSTQADSPNVAKQQERPSTPSGAIAKDRAITGSMDARPLDDPFAGLTGRARVRAVSELVDSLSAAERRAYQEALRMHQPSMVFDAQSTVPASAQIAIRRILAATCQSHSKNEDFDRSRVNHCAPPRSPQARKLSAFELGRLSHQLQTSASVGGAPELMRQVVWSIEVGALKRFDSRHAVHIALKKIREGRWTRPHRMPPNWVRALSSASVPEACGYA
jgi:hypothetical protein